MSAKELGLVSNNESTDTKCKYHMTELKIESIKLCWGQFFVGLSVYNQQYSMNGLRTLQFITWFSTNYTGISETSVCS
jgi:hypothetical protein